MNATVTEFSIVSMILNASLVVKLVMAILLAASIGSWAIILKKRSMSLRCLGTVQSTSSTLSA